MEHNYQIHLSTISSQRYNFLALCVCPTGLIIFNNIRDGHLEMFPSDTSLTLFLLLVFPSDWAEGGFSGGNPLPLVQRESWQLRGLKRLQLPKSKTAGTGT